MPKFKKNPNPIMKKQGYGEGVSPFTMRSGNTTPFKQMGSSPLKGDYHEVLDHWKKFKKQSKKYQNPLINQAGFFVVLIEPYMVGKSIKSTFK